MGKPRSRPPKVGANGHGSEQTQLPGLGVAATASELAPLAQVIQHFHTLYFDAYGAKPAIPPRYLRELKAHVERTGSAEACERLGRLFRGDGPKWLQPPYDLETFVRQYDKLVAVATAQRGRLSPTDIANGKWRA